MPVLRMRQCFSKTQGRAEVAQPMGATYPGHQNSTHGCKAARTPPASSSSAAVPQPAQVFSAAPLGSFIHPNNSCLFPTHWFLLGSPPRHTSQAHQNVYSQSTFPLSSHSLAWRPWPSSTPSQLLQNPKQSLVASSFPVILFRKVGKGCREED